MTVCIESIANGPGAGSGNNGVQCVAAEQRRKGSLPAGATDGGKAALLSLRGYQVVYYVFDFFLFGGDDSLMMEANFTS